jgi:hypothetical protein
MTTDQWTVALPDGAVTFDETTFGMYTPRGFDTCRVASISRGNEVRWLTEGQWLRVDAHHHGARFDLRDREGKLIGWFYAPSSTVGRRCWDQGHKTLPVHTPHHEHTKAER